MNTVGDISIRSLADARRVVRTLVGPLGERTSPGGARVRLGATGANFPATDAELEGYARPLWALGPLAAGGGAFDGWDRYRKGLENGTDPDHREYWGPVSDYSQKAVELAPIGVALALAPDRLWDPLSSDTRDAVTAWIRGVESAELPDSNWLWFRVLATLGLRSVGVDHDWARAERDLDRLESFALEDGWYADGPGGRCDYYSAWELQTNALVYSAIADDDDPRSARFRERATEFAEEFRHWFAADGAALPYGRSLTYRFAQGAFWGALAFADVEALPWGQIRGLWERNLRWWLRQPIFTDGGLLSLGYRYPTLKTTEGYNSPSSPYWGMKAFLPLALPTDHPFWATEPEPLPDFDGEHVQASPGVIVCRDRGAVTALVAGSDAPYTHKYNKFAYSTAFGFGVASDTRGLGTAGVDSTLALSEDGEHFRTRADVSDATVEDGVVRSRWEPWPDVAVETRVVPATPWHVRVHRLRTERPLHSVDGGFALDRSDDDGSNGLRERVGDGVALARSPAGCSGVRDLSSDRDGDVVEQDPNTNVLFPRSAAPVLRGRHDPGTAWIATAVIASPDRDDARWEEVPDLSSGDGIRVEAANGTTLFET